MDDTSTVSRSAVLAALRAKAVDVKEGENYAVTLVCGDRIETLILPNEVGRRMVHLLVRKFKVPIHWFYNPTMLPKSGGTVQ